MPSLLTLTNHQSLSKKVEQKLLEVQIEPENDIEQEKIDFDTIVGESNELKIEKIENIKKPKRKQLSIKEMMKKLSKVERTIESRVQNRNSSEGDCDRNVVKLFKYDNLPVPAKAGRDCGY